MADATKMLPRDFYNEYTITEKFFDYALPLIQGEPELPYKNGLPSYKLLDL